MIITDSFVMINMPKTATTFARQVISKIYNSENKNIFDLELPIITTLSEKGKYSQHGTVEQIPKEHKHKKIISISRNPFDRLISLYTFGWWKHTPPASFDEIKISFPNFPQLSFIEFVEMVNLFSVKNILEAYDFKKKIALGVNSVQYIAYYSKNVYNTYNKIYNLNNYSYKDIVEDFPDITFLRQECLRDDLYDFLLNEGHNRILLENIIFNYPQQNVSRNEDLIENSIYTNDIYEKIYKLEYILLEKFPQYKNFL